MEKRIKTRYDVQSIVQYVVEAGGSDSEFSNLDDEETDTENEIEALTSADQSNFDHSEQDPECDGRFIFIFLIIVRKVLLFLLKILINSVIILVITIRVIITFAILIGEKDENKSDEGEQEKNNESTSEEQLSEHTGNDNRTNNSPEPTKQNSGKCSNKRVYRWRSYKPQATDSVFKGNGFSLPPDDADKFTPLTYFHYFWTDEMTVHLVDQTNLYSVQKSGTNVKTTKEEMEQFIGIQMRMGIVSMPRYQNFWAAETRYAPVADTMSLKRYEKLRQFLHANDNSTIDASNSLYKVEPILSYLRNNCQKLEQEEYQSIDEQIVPAKTKYSGIRQYNPKKPHKWGFKNFVRAGKSGLI